VTILTDIFAGLFGLILGSFFNVVIWRVPRGESIVRPGSHCPGCGRPIKPWHNIPVISYLFLGGRCASCRKRISVEYPIVELLTCVAAVAVWHGLLWPAITQGLPLWRIIEQSMWAVALLSMIPVFFIDLHHYIIPDSISVTGFAVSLLLSFMPGGITPLQSLIGVLTGAGFFLILGKGAELLLKKDEALGGGDIKLLAFLGALWGWKGAAMVIIFGSLLGSVVGVAMLITRKLNQEHKIPFGPFLAAAAWISVFWGEPIARWYLGLVEVWVAR